MQTRERVRVRLTKQGGALVVVMSGFTLGALNTGTNLLYFITALSLNLLLANLILSRRSLRGLSVARQAPERVVQGAPCELLLEVTDPRGKPRAFPVEVRERPPRGMVATRPRGLLLGLGAGERVRLRLSTVCLRRGLHLWPGVELACRGPFGLLECRQRLTLPWRVRVVPPVHPLRVALLEQEAPRAEAVARRLVFSAERRDLFRSLRDHRPGDDVRTIHWRASARRGSPMVKEFERTAPDTALVLLDLAGDDDPLAADAAATLAASLHHALIRRREPVALGLLGAEGVTCLPPGGGEAVSWRARELLAELHPAGDADLRELVRRVGPLAAGARTLLVTTRRDARPLRQAFPAARVLEVQDPAALARFCQLPGGEATG